jgi:hypothetical protein
MTDPDDRKDQLCTECGVGRYQETSIHDDWDGVLHCNNKKCNHEVKRYKSDDNPEPAVEKAKLSPAAQAVLDAVINVAESPDAEAIAAAVLRALLAEKGEVYFDENGKITDFVVMQGDILTIAKELEAA